MNFEDLLVIGTSCFRFSIQALFVQDLNFYDLSLKLNMLVDSNLTRPMVRENLTNHRFIILTHTHGFYRTCYMTTKGHHHLIYLNEYVPIWIKYISLSHTKIKKLSVHKLQVRQHFSLNFDNCWERKIWRFAIHTSCTGF